MTTKEYPSLADLHTAWLSITCLKGRTESDFISIIEQCLQGIITYQADDDTPKSSSTGSIEVQWWPKQEDIRIFVTDHRRY
jgi:hypothetical protein